jgi:hypothetical protein
MLGLGCVTNAQRKKKKKREMLTLGADLNGKRLSNSLGEEVGVSALNAKAAEGSLSDGSTKVTH